MSRKQQGLIVVGILLMAIWAHFRNHDQPSVPKAELSPTSSVEVAVNTTTTLPLPSQKEVVVMETAQKSKPEMAPELSAEVGRFRQMAEEAKKSIPLKKDLQSMTAKEVHMTPASIQVAAIKIGELAQAIHDDPRLAPEGLSFYRECAESDDYPNSVRASCLVNHGDLLKSSNLKAQSLEQDPKIPSHVRELAKTIQ
jgi:hypothetical protein